MLNDDVCGGYLIWTTPEYPVFVDGRSDVFEWTGVLGDFGKWASSKAILTSSVINTGLISVFYLGKLQWPEFYH